jgi:hypothetical protein
MAVNWELVIDQDAIDKLTPNEIQSLLQILEKAGY